MADISKITEVDKLMKKIDMIYTAIKGKPDENAVDLRQVKDEFEKIRYEVNQKLSEVETFLSKRDDFKTNEGRDVLERAKLQDKVDTGMKEIDGKLGELDRVLRSQKAKPKKFGDVSYKEEARKLMEERYRLLSNRNEGLPYDEKAANQNKTNLEKLDELLIEKAQGRQAPDREMYEEEKQYIDEWGNEIKRQDEMLEGVGHNIKRLKGDVRQIGQQIDETGKNIKKTKKMADKTEETLKTTNAKLKELLNKLRSGDRICIDIILICVCLGLIAVLYNIIKNKISGSETTATTNTEPTKTFLMM
jgi:methyl-accepting chemotaxis protein